MNYIKKREDDRKAAVSYCILCLLGSLSDEDLRTLELPMSIMNDIYTVRKEDDMYGTAAAYITSSLANQDLTEADQLVVGNIMMVAGSLIAKGGIVRKSDFDKANVLVESSFFKDILEFFSFDVVSQKMSPPSWEENVVRTVEYIEQYDRDVKDKSFKAFNFSNEGENEEPSTPKLLDYIMGLGR